MIDETLVAYIEAMNAEISRLTGTSTAFVHEGVRNHFGTYTLLNEIATKRFADKQREIARTVQLWAGRITVYRATRDLIAFGTRERLRARWSRG